jgi:D-arabinonate dehydratase
MKLTSASAWRCPIRLPYTLTLGRARSTVREYVILRLDSDDGGSGVAVGYTRGTPLLEAAEILCGALDPEIGWRPEDQQADLRARFGPGWGALVRAASLIDIALSDLQANPGDPATSGPAPSPPSQIMAVAGYFADQRPMAEICSEASRLVEEGASIVKVMVPGLEPSADRALFSEIAAVIGGRARLGVDLHGSCESVESALRAGEAFAALGAEFLEDPFPGHPLRDLSLYARSSPLPLAVGEDLIDESLVLELAELAAYVRLDATASGGYTFARRALGMIENTDARALPHVFPATHARLTEISNAIEAIEVIPSYIGADPLDVLLLDPAGSLLEPLSFDWRAVESHAAARWSRTLN